MSEHKLGSLMACLMLPCVVYLLALWAYKRTQRYANPDYSRLESWGRNKATAARGVACLSAMAGYNPEQLDDLIRAAKAVVRDYQSELVHERIEDFKTQLNLFGVK